jgi:hypothetical protein
MLKLLPTHAVAIFAAAMLGCPAADDPVPKQAFDPYASASSPGDYEDWYPESVMAPEGMEYPVRLLPLPPSMKGLPGLDHGYLNHVFSQIVVAAEANLTMKQQLGTSDQESALAAYTNNATEIQETLDAETIPKGLQPFHDDLTAALRLQLAYFQKAGALVDERMLPLFESEASEAGLETGRSAALSDARSVIELKAATAKLTAAWSKLSRRYTGHWDDTVRDAIYSHLRALEL